MTTQPLSSGETLRAPAGRLRTRYVAPSALSPEAVDELWTFFDRFVQRPRADFERALRGVDGVYLARDAGDGLLRGFAALKVYDVEVEGRRAGAIYTLWSAIDPACRGRNLLQRAGLRSFLQERLRHPTRPLYWVFGASTFKSYLLLPRNFVDYWPRPEGPMPAREAAIVAEVMRQSGAEGWDPEEGVLHRHGVSRYREGVVADEPAALADPHVRFYAARNPRQEEGDSLLCICPLTTRNWLSAAGGIVRRWRSGRSPARPGARR